MLLKREGGGEGGRTRYWCYTLTTLSDNNSLLSTDFYFLVSFDETMKRFYEKKSKKWNYLFLNQC